MQDSREYRWMLFVDGENFTIRGEGVAKEHGLALKVGQWYSPGEFLWIPGHPGIARQGRLQPAVEWIAIRASYYTSVCGDDDRIQQVRDSLRALSFDPNVFKKVRKSDKAKGVDIALTNDMLSHAFLGNYETAVLVTGDRDFLPVIEQVKRLGKRVHLHFFGGKNTSDALRIAADEYFDLTDHFSTAWKQRQ